MKATPQFTIDTQQKYTHTVLITFYINNVDVINYTLHTKDYSFNLVDRSETIRPELNAEPDRLNSNG